MLTLIVLLLVMAVVANFFSALAGGGAGLLQLPLLIFMGLPFSVALATHKVATVALGVGASVRHYRNASFDVARSVLIMVVGVPMVVVGALSTLWLPAFWCQLVLSMLTIGLGVYSIVKPSLGQQQQLQPLTPKFVTIGIVGIAVIGYLNGSLSSGTGLFLTVWLVRWFGFDYQRAAAHTLIWVGLGWNFTGAVSLGVVGQVHWAWVLPLIIGALIGGYLGAHTAIKQGNAWVKRSFELLTILTGVSLLLKTLL